MVLRSKITKDILDYYFKRNLDLIPIDPKHGKKPLHNKWQKRQYNKAQIFKYANNGYALGFRINSRHCVIDVDPRNKGKEGLKDLSKFLKIADFAEIAPTVITGGDGLHFYFSIESNKKLKESTEQFKGIEFKTHGRQVLIPGSIHPSGKYYSFDDWSPIESPFPKLPAQLIELLEYKPKESTAIQLITPSELKAILDQLPIENYSTNESWFPILAAAYNATAGQGADVFINWSIGDPIYSNQEKIIFARWESLQNELPVKRSLGTLYQELFKYNGKIPESIEIKNDFREIPEITEAGKTFELKNLIDEIDILPPNITQKDLTKYFKLIYDKKDDVLKDKIFRKIKDSQNISLSSIKSMYKGYEKSCKKDAEIFETAESIDYAVLVAERVLKIKFKDGKTLIHAKNQQFYHYIGTHWKHIQQNMIEKIIFETAESMLINSDLDFKTSNILINAEKVLRAKTATDVDLLRFESTPPSIINTLNYEIHINDKTGKIKLKKHNPESYLTYCLNVEFDKNAKCPIFEKSLYEIFENAKDVEWMISYQWEILGYMIQPKKNIACWFILHGHGNNGKSYLTNVWIGLLGVNSVLPRALSEFANTNQNNHALASLPGKLMVLDDDVKQNAKLPDGALKKLSENKQLESNPKSKDAFVFTSIATPVMCTNHWPIVGDVGRGFLRRANLIPFDRHFEKDEMDLELKYKVLENELPGVLNMALKGLRRLRKRGYFDPPIECREKITYWLGLTNPVMRFVYTKCKPDKSSKVKFSVLFDAYRIWVTSDRGYKKVVSAGQFEEYLIQLEYKVKGNIVYGLKMHKN